MRAVQSGGGATGPGRGEEGGQPQEDQRDQPAGGEHSTGAGGEPGQDEIQILLSEPSPHHGADEHAGGLALPRQVLHLLHLHPAGAERDGAHLGPGPVRHVQPSDWGE